jgi:hypothetical protein
MRQGKRLVIARLMVVMIATIAYLLLLPIEIAFEDGLVVSLPIFFSASPTTPPTFNWNYLFAAPISLLIILIGFEVIHLLEARRSGDHG